MNANPLSTALTRSSPSVALGTRSQSLHQHLARRVGLALLAWSRSQDERRSTDAVQLRRRTEQDAAEVLHEQYRRAALLASTML